MLYMYDQLRMRLWDPRFGQPAVEVFSRGGAPGPVDIATSGLYQWWYTIGLRTNQDLFTGSVFLTLLSGLFLFVGGFIYNPNFSQLWRGLRMLSLV